LTAFTGRLWILVRQTAVSHLLDSGCGEGFVLDYFRQNGLNITAVGADLRPEAIRWAKANLLPDLNGTVADIHRLPFAANSFPLVMSLEVLEHIPDSSLGLRELLRVSSRYSGQRAPRAIFSRGQLFAGQTPDPLGQ
jgi:SAM-dependent methyltransferase